MTRPPIVVRIARVLAVPGRHLSLHRASRTLAVALLAALMATSGCTQAATQPPPFPSTSDGSVYLVDADTNTGYAASAKIDWDAAKGVIVSAVATPTAPTAPTATEPMRLPFVNGSLTETPFISAPGSERTPASWRAWSDTVPLNGKGSLLPNVTPSEFGNGAASLVKSTGGTYSIGIAYEDSPTHVTAAYFTTINVTAGTGAFTFATPRS